MAEEGSQVDAIYTDFSKAFDSVSNKLLIKKLRVFGFGGFFLDWLASFIMNRIQIVSFRNSLSRSISVTSGVLIWALFYLIYL